MTKLQKLVANGESGLNDNGISQLNLVEFNSEDNPR